MASFDLAALIAAGWSFSKDASGWNAVGPDKQHGHGESAEEAYLNVGAQVIARPDGVRVRYRADGSEFILDAWARPAAPAEEVPAAPDAEVA